MLQRLDAALCVVFIACGITFGNIDMRNRWVLLMGVASCRLQS